MKSGISSQRDVTFPFTDDMWDITRVIPQGAVMGKAAETASAMANDFAKLAVHELQKRLSANGVKLHIDKKAYVMQRHLNSFYSNVFLPL